MYEAYVTRIKNVRKHSNADRLLVGECFGNNVIVDLRTKEDDLGIYFPTDGKLGLEYATEHNLLRRKDDQGNEVGGYLDAEKRNIKAIKLRGEKSDGLFMPIASLSNFCSVDELMVGDRITVLNGITICEKYIPKGRGSKASNGKAAPKSKKTMLFPLFKEHIDTEQLDYNIGNFKENDLCYITLKMHGTSQRTSYTLVENNKNFITKLIGKYIKKWKVVTGTRRVVLQNIEKSTVGGFYNDDSFRKQWHDFFKDKLQKGETVYYEVVGYSNEATPIMTDGANKKVNDKDFLAKYGETTRFSYGCSEGFSNAYVYRMTITNEDGYVVEYPWEVVKLRCEEMGANAVPEFEKFMFTNKEDLLERVEKYLDIEDPVGKTHVSEGVVVRIENKKVFKAYKKKGFYFKVLERNNKR